MREATHFADLRVGQLKVNGKAVNNAEQVETSRNVKAMNEVELILDKRMVGEVAAHLVM